MSSPIGNNPRPPVAAPSSSAPDMRLNVTSQSPQAEIVAALGKYGLDEASALSWVGQVDTITSKESQTRVYQKVELKMVDFARAHPNATPEEISKEAKKHLMAQTLMYKYIEKSIMDMAQQAIVRMNDRMPDGG